MSEQKERTPGPWRIGTTGGCVVADGDTGFDDEENIAAYGGHLICESVWRRANTKLIAAAPDLLDAVAEDTAGVPVPDLLRAAARVVFEAGDGPLRQRLEFAADEIEAAIARATS